MSSGLIQIRDGHQTYNLWIRHQGEPENALPRIAIIAGWMKNGRLPQSSASAASWLVSTSHFDDDNVPTLEEPEAAFFELCQNKKPHSLLREGDYVYKLTCANTYLRVEQAYRDEATNELLEKPLGSLRKFDPMGVQRLLVKLGRIVPSSALTTSEGEPISVVIEPAQVPTEVFNPPTVQQALPETYSLLGGVLANRSQANHGQPSSQSSSSTSPNPDN